MKLETTLSLYPLLDLSPYTSLYTFLRHPHAIPTPFPLSLPLSLTLSLPLSLPPIPPAVPLADCGVL
jgi:hypothetical protein